MDSAIVDSRNSTGPLDRLITLCDGAETLSIAVGFLFMDGLAPLLPQMERLQRTQLLIGNVVNRLTEEQIHEAAVNRRDPAGPGQDEMFAKGLREERDRIAVETALNMRESIDAMPRTNANKKLIIDLATLIARGKVQIRLLTNRRLHAKAALVTYPQWHAKAPGAGLIGSSNLTFSASYAGKRQLADWSPDLDVQVEGTVNIGYLNDWFGAHWAEAQDFQKELFEELGQSWPLQTGGN